MGRAIEVEKAISDLKSKVQVLEHKMYLIIEAINEMEDLDEEEKTNDEGSGKSSGKPNKRKSTSKAKSNENSGGSK